MVSPTAAVPPLAPSADVFSMGVMLWELCAKQRLFTSKIDAAIVQKVLTGPIAALGSVAGVSVPAPLEEAVKKALERDPAKRTPPRRRSRRRDRGPRRRRASRRPRRWRPRSRGSPARRSPPRKAEVRAEIGRRGLGQVRVDHPAARRAQAGLAPAQGDAARHRQPRRARSPRVEAPSGRSPSWPREAGRSPPRTAEPVPPAAPKPAHPARPRRGGGAKGPEPSPGARPPRASTSRRSRSRPRRPPRPRRRGVRLRRRSATLVMGTPVDARGRRRAEDRDEKTVAPPSRPPRACVRAGAARGGGARGGRAGGGGSKTAPTPASDGTSPRGKSARGIEKVGPGQHARAATRSSMPVARGGMASVWAARLPGSRGFQKIFAIKTMLPDVSDDPEFESMFLDEGARRRAHPPPERGRDHRPRRAGRRPLPRDGVGRGREPRRARQGRARPSAACPCRIILRIASQICRRPPRRPRAARRRRQPRSTWSTATSRPRTCSSRRAAS